MVMQSVFISYRWKDSAIPARYIAEIIEENFSNTTVFIDTQSIQIGGSLSDTIQQALNSASILIVVIGPEWLKAYDECGRRRIDDPKDWVHQEILFALKNELKVIPLLVSNAELPLAKALPEDLVALLNHRAYPLRQEFWSDDCKLFDSKLKEVGLSPIQTKINYPAPVKKVRPLSIEELETALHQLPHWKLINRRDFEGNQKQEISRNYSFSSFEDAIHFMATASRRITKNQHHPEWHNLYKTVTVWLTTWDIGHTPSVYDIKLADYLDQLYMEYQPSKKQTNQLLKSTR